MNFHKIAWKAIAAMLVLALVVALIPTVLQTDKVLAQGKSLYVIADIAGNPTPIQAYSIQPAPTYLGYQATSGVPRYAGGAVGLAIDTDSAILFVTYEVSNKIQLVDATTMADEGSITAPNASNLAGIVVDQGNQKVYTVDRNTNHLYVYSWNATTKTLTNDITTSPYYISLPGVSNAHGLALDELNDLLYVGGEVATSNVRVFSTAGWSAVTSYTMSQPVQGIAIDVVKKLIYTGHAGWPPTTTPHLLCKLDMDTMVETTVDIRTLTTSVNEDSVVGLAVDPESNLLYITTGNMGSQGRPYYDDTDMLMVFDSDLNLLHNTGDIGNPTGLCIPGKPISYNPLNLAKTDGLANDACVSPGQNINYTISYDNTNPYSVSGVTITDTLPPEVSYVSNSVGGIYNAGPPETVTWNIGALAPGASGSVTLTVQVKSGTPGGTTITNSSTLVSNETGPAFTDEETDTCTNQPPTVDAGGPYNGSEMGPPVVFNATGTDPDNDPLQYRWDLDNNGTWDTPYDSAPGTTYLWTDDYTGTVKVEVWDGTATATDTATVTIANYAPLVDIGNDGPPPNAPITAYSGNNVHLVASFKDTPSDTHTYSWDFGDTTSASGPVTTPPLVNADHIYTDGGTYTVTLTVTDDNGGVGTDTIVVTVIKIVKIDVKPGSWPNSINLNGNGVVAVGVFGTAAFDVNDIDVSTVRCGVNKNDAEPVHSGHIEDINGDGIDDIVFHFREGDLDIDVDTPGNTEMPLYITGQTNGSMSFEGKDTIRITPNDDKSRGKGGKGPK
ncbi:PKD domain-containing protein [Chloroflexota bacterium]